MSADVLPQAGVQAPRRVSLWEIAWVFGRVSATAFGGSSIIMMRREMIQQRGWMTEKDFLEIYALAQVSPGGIPITIAVLAGRRMAGTAGFFTALIAETVPGFCVLIALAMLAQAPHMELLRAGLRGAAAAAVGSMLANAIQLSWPYRTKFVDLILLVFVATSVLAGFHFGLVQLDKFSLAQVLTIFLPLSIIAVRLRGGR